MTSDQPQRTSHQPGPLAILAVTAIGGVIGSRLGKAPLFLAAGAAALALLNQKKTAAPPARPQPQPQPVPQPENPAQHQVEEWLSRQIIREEQAPVIDFSKADLPPAEEPEDDYHPGSFLLDDADEFSAVPSPGNDSFAGLTEPAPQPLPEPAPEMERVEEEQAEDEQEAPLPPQQSLEPSPPAAADAAWTLGVDPMPSLNDPAPYVAPAGSLYFSTPVRQEVPITKQEPPRSHMFSTAPLRQEEPGPPLFFSTSVFQGAAFPDEIKVAPTIEPVPPLTPPTPSAEAPMLRAEPLIEPPPVAVTAPEIPVELAAPGDASFDSPLAAMPENPWQPEPKVFAATPSVPVQTQATSTVVEAEIILRPRAPTQNAVAAKSKFNPASFGKPFSDEVSAPPPAEAANDAHFPGPLQSQRDPKPHPTWRSWWRGD